MSSAARFKKLLKLMLPSQLFWLPRYYLFYKRLNPNDKNLIMLDAGCGEGTVTIELAKKKLNIVGVDRSFIKIKEAHRNCNKDIFVASDINCLPFRESTFDLIFSLDVLEYVKDLKEEFAEFHRILKPKGKVIISVTKGYDCSAKLFSLQRILRKIMPRFLYTHDFSKGRAWLSFTDKDMKEELGHVKTYSLDELIEESRGFFKVMHWQYYIKIFTALARDIVYGIKGFYYLRFPLFFIAVRIDRYIFKKMKGYSIFMELEKR